MKDPHGLRKFGRRMMQNCAAPCEAVEHFMGQATSTYGKRLVMKEGLLKLYMCSHPKLDEKSAAQQVIDFANRFGPSLGPKALHDMKCRNIKVHADPYRRSKEAARA